MPAKDNPRPPTYAESIAISEAIAGSPDSPEVRDGLVAIFPRDVRRCDPVAVVVSVDGRRSWTLTPGRRGYWVIRSVGFATLAPGGD